MWTIVESAGLKGSGGGTDDLTISGAGGSGGGPGVTMEVTRRFLRRRSGAMTGDDGRVGGVTGGALTEASRGLEGVVAGAWEAESPVGGKEVEVARAG
eukprot:s4600_g6.t1